MLPELKDKALKTIYFMLTSKSEQERKLLVSLVNKLGDPQNKSASNADYHLTNLLADHPNMKAVVIDEVDSFLFRPHLGLRAKYHAVCPLFSLIMFTRTIFLYFLALLFKLIHAYCRLKYCL
jgi:ribosome biogenesis protein MAK21